MKRFCKNCIHFCSMSANPGDVGSCLRYPPKGTPSTANRYPIVDPEDWCGEFKPKRKE